MIKIKATDNWYKTMAEIEASHDISAGGAAIREAVPAEQSETGHAIVHRGKPSKDKTLRIERRWVGYCRFMHMLRIQRKLTIEQLAQKIDVDPEQLLLIESKIGYKAPARTLTNLANFYNLPMRGFLQLAGALAMDKRLEENMVKFAAESDSFETLSADEKRLLNNVIKLISDRSSIRTNTLEKS